MSSCSSMLMLRASSYSRHVSCSAKRLATKSNRMGKSLYSSHGNGVGNGVGVTMRNIHTTSTSTSNRFPVNKLLKTGTAAIGASPVLLQVSCFSSDLSNIKITKSSQQDPQSTQEKSPTPSEQSEKEPPSSPSLSNASDSDSDNDSDSNSGSTSKLKKNQQQKAEEELLMLQSHVKQHFQNANYTTALTTSRTILQKSTDLFGNLHPSTASAHNNIGLMHKMMGEFDESRENYHEALRVYERIVGKDHASYAAALNNLGNLDRAQSMVGYDGNGGSNANNGDGNDGDSNDGKDGESSNDSNQLTALQRMQLNDSAIEYFQQAYNIRQVELGEEHVYTVTSRSNLGGAIAAQVLRGEWTRQQKLKDSLEARQEQIENGDFDGEKGDGEKGEKDGTWAVSKYTREKWDVAEEHLRAAFRTAVNNPRGETVAVPKASTDASTGTDADVDSPKRRDKNLSKKEKQKAAKLRKKLERQNNQGARSGSGSGSGSVSGEDANSKGGLGIGNASICTLSSAAAGQNLAVFLKSRADLLVHSTPSNADPDADANPDPSLDSGDMYAEAKNLYVGALRVRTALKGEFHPDSVATKFSLAELIDAVGDEAGANVLRQELLDAYQVVEEHENDEDGDGDSKD